MKVIGKDNFTVIPTVNGDEMVSVSGTPSTNDLLEWNGSDWVPAAPGSSIFGSEMQQTSSDGLSSTTSTTFQQKLRMTTASLPSGTYRIAWSYEWRCQNTSYDFRGQVQINDTTTIMEQRQESQDAGSDQLHKNSGFYYHTGSGVLDIDVDYCISDGAGGSAYIQRARLEIWRAS